MEQETFVTVLARINFYETVANGPEDSSKFLRVKCTEWTGVDFARKDAISNADSLSDKRKCFQFCDHLNLNETLF